jgi:hypothetical protein
LFSDIFFSPEMPPKKRGRPKASDNEDQNPLEDSADELLGSDLDIKENFQLPSTENTGDFS